MLHQDAEAQNVKSEEDIIDSYVLRPVQTRPLSYASTAALVPSPPGQDKRARNSWNFGCGRAKHRDPQVPFSRSSNSLDVSSCFLSLLRNWKYMLLLCIPAAWAVRRTPGIGDAELIIFVFCLIAKLPLKKLLDIGTDELSMHVAKRFVDFIDVTLGNLVELILAVIALAKCELEVVQSTLIGAILSRLLLVLGMCFFAGGTRHSEQEFGTSACQINSSLLTLSVVAVLLPAAFHFSVHPSSVESKSSVGKQTISLGAEFEDIKSMSHLVAIVLLFTYIAHVFFQLWSHAHFYEEGAEPGHLPKPKILRSPVISQTPLPPAPETDAKRGKLRHRGPGENSSKSGISFHRKESSSSTFVAITEPPTAHEARSTVSSAEALLGTAVEGEAERKPTMNIYACIALLAGTTTLVAITSEWLIDSVDVVSASGRIKKQWVGLILIPIVGNAAEHATAVSVSLKNKLDLSIGVAVGSSIQIALCIIPLMVMIAWFLGKPLLLLFDPYESVTLFLSVVTVNYVVQDGKSNWLEGMILICLYLIIAISFWYYPGSEIAETLENCVSLL